MAKIVFSDFDNTMLRYYSDKNYFDSYQLNILKRLHENGIMFVIVTGRCVSFFEQFPLLLEFVDFILASNGACIYDVREGKFIYQKLLDQHSLCKIIHYAIDNQYKFILNCLDRRYICEDCSSIDDVFKDKELFDNCEQIVLFTNRINYDSCYHYLSSLENVLVNNVCAWNSFYTIDVNAIGVSKGNSIVKLCHFLNIDIKDTIGFGDGENDISMFQVVGFSVAVKNASIKIQNTANDIALECENNGVFKYLEDKILK